MKNTKSFLALCASLVLASCGGGNNSSSGDPSSNPPAPAPSTIANTLTITGQAILGNSSQPRPNQLHLHITANGSNLFTEAGGDCNHDAFTPGVYDTDLSADGSGNFAITIPMTDFVSAVEATCAINREVAVGQLDLLEVMVGTNADPDTCASYCADQTSPADNQRCTTACQNGNRKITAYMRVKHNALVALDASSINGVAALKLTPTLNSLGIPINNSGKPDFVVDAEAAKNSWYIETRNFDAADCAVVEGCVGGTGKRRLLRFDGDFANAGDTDFVLGSPINNSRFKYSDCHKHYHLQGIMKYTLINSQTNQPIVTGNANMVTRKQGFCVEDTLQAGGFAKPKYTCDNQGLTSGWEDVYGAPLDCQWIDITGVPNGAYILRITVNPEHLYEESDYDNDDGDVHVTIGGSDTDRDN